MEIEVLLTGVEREFLDQRIRSGRAASEGEVLREALQLLMDRERDHGQEYERWRDAARRSIEIGHQECLDGKTVDGEAALERIRVRIARWKPTP